MQDQAKTTPVVDPNNDPVKLAKIGADVSKRLTENPNIIPVDVPDIQLYIFQDFLPASDCQMLIEKIDAQAIPSTLYEGTEQVGFRTSSSCNLNRWDSDIMRIETLMEDVLGIENRFSETMQGQRYYSGQQFKPHHDFFHVEEAYWQKEGPHGGQRTWTAMIFLNEPEAGGETEFPQIQIGVRPQTGMMLIWNNMNPNGTMNYKTLHTGKPVEKGMKHIITKWYRQNDWLTLHAR